MLRDDERPLRGTAFCQPVHGIDAGRFEQTKFNGSRLRGDGLQGFCPTEPPHRPPGDHCGERNRRDAGEEDEGDAVEVQLPQNCSSDAACITGAEEGGMSDAWALVMRSGSVMSNAAAIAPPA